MKKFLFYASLLSVAFFSSCGPSNEDAIKFNNSINEVVDKVDIASNTLIDQLDGKNSNSLSDAYDEYTNVTSMAAARCSMIKPIDDDSKYYYAALAHFENLKSLRDKELMQIVLSQKKIAGDSIPDNNEIVANENRIQKFTLATKETKDALLAEQKKFCEKWNIPLK